MIDEQAVRYRMAAVVHGQVSIDNFEDWLVGESWNMHVDSSHEAQELVASAKLAIVENSMGDISESQLREQFVHLLENINVSVDVAPHQSVYVVRWHSSNSATVLQVQC